MKTIYVFTLCTAIALCSCKKEMQQTRLNGSSINNDTQSDGPVRKPVFVLASTTKSQFVATASGNGSSDFTLNFSSEEAGVTIESLTFLSYAADSNDALSVSIGEDGFPGFFQPTNFFGNAKAITHIDGTDIKLPDDGSNIPVTFHVRYRSTLMHGIKSGDTVSIQITGLEYINRTSPFILHENIASDFSPKMVITGAKPVLEVINDVDLLHKGLNKIFTIKYSSEGGLVGINNLPLHIEAFGTRFSKNLIIKDEKHHIIPAHTIRDNNQYRIRFPAEYSVDENSPHTFYVYAPVYEVEGKAFVRTHLQKPENFSWTDIAGERTTPYTTENETYLYNYPSTVLTVHN
ncbi:MAG: hypothetical protein ABJA35_05295 [Parafilimonas sp.]